MGLEVELAHQALSDAARREQAWRTGIEDLSERLCIARAVANEPEIILMDEPCSALDPIATAKVEDLITELKKDYTIVIVTHNMQQASRCSIQNCKKYFCLHLFFLQRLTKRKISCDNHGILLYHCITL